MLLPRKSILRLGSHSKKNTKNSFLARTVPTTNLALLKSDAVSRSNLTKQRDTFIASTERYVRLQELFVVSLKTIRRKTFASRLPTLILGGQCARSIAAIFGRIEVYPVHPRSTEEYNFAETGCCHEDQICS